jgi:carbonic anhydrase/acetyltransferase-like protein (isoleucine patch superfamily)
VSLLLDIGGRAPRIAASAWLAPGVVLTGDVEIGEQTTVWFGVIARGDTESIVLEWGSNVQDGSVLHADPGMPLRLGRDAAVGHGAVVHGCTIGEGALIGMGAVVMNGADIGAGSTIAAGAVVRESERIPPRSLAVGVPARVVRDGVEHRGPAICRHYRELAVKYAAALGPDT